jgi:hypothetical protein
MTLHMRIVQGNELVADLPEWPHPIPRVGDYIFHPPYGDHVPEGIAGCVKVVTWRTHDRPAGPEAASFVMTAHPYVEIRI